LAWAIYPNPIAAREWEEERIPHWLSRKLSSVFHQNLNTVKDSPKREEF
jgi:hypothetical protein